MNLSRINNFFTTFLHNVELAWRLFFDMRIPLLTKIIFIVVLSIYVLSPIDFVPDLLPVVGQVDDLVVLVFCLIQFIEACPLSVIDEHKLAIANGEWKIPFLKFLTGGGR